jgi:ABC-type uncharacterized transport system permease subunit
MTDLIGFGLVALIYVSSRFLNFPAVTVGGSR